MAFCSSISPRKLQKRLLSCTPLWRQNVRPYPVHWQLSEETVLPTRAAARVLEALLLALLIDEHSK